MAEQQLTVVAETCGALTEEAPDLVDADAPAQMVGICQHSPMSGKYISIKGSPAWGNIWGP